MPVQTPHYGLTAFTRGDIYSSASDQLRFKRIDNLLAFLSDLATDGRIEGWQVLDNSSSAVSQIKVTAGMGIIERYVTRTFNDLFTTVPDNTISYIYMQRKYNFIADLGEFSDIVTVDYSDTTAPDVPVTPHLVSSVYNLVTIGWVANTEPDLAYYTVQRSTDGVTYVDLEETTVSVYEDDSIIDNTTYFYRIIAVDQSDNASIASAPLTVTVPADLTPPTNPGFVLVFVGDERIELMWQQPSAGNVLGYEARLQKINEDHALIGPVKVYSAGALTTNLIIDGLDNGIMYKIVFYAIGTNGVYSSGIIKLSRPVFNTGPVEVSDITISDVQSQISPKGIKLSIEWTPGFDPYRLPADVYIITLIENGATVSDPIYVYNFNAKEIEIFPVSGINQAVISRTDYIVKIVGKDSEGRTNNGTLARVKTRHFNAPSTVTDLTATRIIGRGIIFAWNNSKDIFDHNIIKLTEVESSTTISIENGTDIGRQNSYVIADALVDLEATYTFSIKTVDEFGNENSYISTDIYTQSLVDIPDIPLDQFAFAGVGETILLWKERPVQSPVYYRIWRADFSDRGVLGADFQLIDVIPAGRTTYTDYSAVLGNRYYYFLTTIDQWGRESKNPVDDDFYFYPLVYAFGGNTLTFSKPANVVVTNSGVPDDHDAVVSWDVSDDQFDGYEIYRSKGNRYSWVRTGSTDRYQTSFTDEDGLLDSATYYYMVRKFRNESILFVTTSPAAPIDSILLAKVSSSFGLLTIDNTVANDLAGWIDPLLSFVDAKLDVHQHTLSDSADQRIDLAEYVIITNWFTNDNQVFRTNQNISGATSYIVRVDNALTNILYEVKPYSGTVIFSVPVDGDISLECVGLSETSSELPGVQVEQVFGTQVEGDMFAEAQIPQLDHFGRMREELIPLQLRLETDDGYSFSIVQNSDSDIVERIGSAVTFYDIISAIVPDQLMLCWDIFTYSLWDGFSYNEWTVFPFDCVGQPPLGEIPILIAATSWGLLSSLNDGDTWTISMIPDAPPHKLYYAAISNKYYLLTGSSVYVSYNGLNWVRTNKIEAASVIRDIVEDDHQNIYVTTDIGVFILEPGSVGDYLDWQQTRLMSGTSSDCYAIYYDSTNDRIIVSTGIGLFATSNTGLSWSYISDFDEEKPIYQFLESNGFLFALADGEMWRKPVVGHMFVKIADLEADVSRRFVIFSNRIIANSDDGIRISWGGYNIYTDTGIEFDNNLGDITISPRKTEVTCVSVVGSVLLIGTDERLFSGTSLANIGILYENLNDIIPIFYINGERQVLGFNYDVNNNVVVFDHIISEDDVVTVANQYEYYKAKHGGWVDQNYTSNVKILNNDRQITEIAAPGSTAVVSSFTGVTFPTFTEFNSNSTSAIIFAADYNSEVTRLQNVLDSTELLAPGESIQSIMSGIVGYFYKTYSQWLGFVNFKSEVDINSNSYTIVGFERVLSSLENVIFSTYTLVDNIPSIEIQVENVVQADAVTGIFKFNSSFDKYNDMSIIIGRTTFSDDGVNSHNDLDDTIEHINSGLPAAGLALIEQANIVKTGIFLEKQWPGEQSTLSDPCCGPGVLSPPLQSVYIIPRDRTWYDQLNSTIDYEGQIDCGDLGLSVSYPTAVLYVEESNQVLVGCDEGLLSIATVPDQLMFHWNDFTYSQWSSFSYNEWDLFLFNHNNTIDLSMFAMYFSDHSEPVRDLVRSDDIIYLLAENRLYISTDYGYTWSRQEMKGLTRDFLKIVIINGTKVIAARDGVYYLNDRVSQWTKCFSFGGNPALPADFNQDGRIDIVDLGILGANWEGTNKTFAEGDANGDGLVNLEDLVILSRYYYRADVSMAASPSAVLFFVSDMLFMVVNDELYYSLNGVEWSYGGDFGSVQVNDIETYAGIRVLSTSNGLRYDNGTFYSGGHVVTSVVDLLTNLTNSTAMEFNAVAVNNDGNKFVAGMADGTFYLFEDGVFSAPKDICVSGLDAIHKIIFVGDDYWMFGFDKLKVSSLAYAITLSTGIPF